MLSPGNATASFGQLSATDGGIDPPHPKTHPLGPHEHNKELGGRTENAITRDRDNSQAETGGTGTSCGTTPDTLKPPLLWGH